MRAVILAGGSGTRLRPLTCDRPKPMVRICGRPVIEYGLDLLTESRIEEATITLGYLAEAISDYYGHGYGPLSLRYTTEEKPLGTAGAARLATAGGQGPAVILSGDAVCDFDLSAMMARFAETGADALIAVKRVEDPREYGLVLCGEDGRVTDFIEKPSYLQAVSELANTGIYILSDRALALIPPDETYDFAGDLFPLMLRQGLSIYAMPQSGYWCDIGDIGSYIRCQGDLLSGQTRCRFISEEAPAGDYALSPPVYIGRGVEIGSGCVIEGPCVIDDNVMIGAGCKLKDSVVLPGARIGRGASLSGALVDSRADIGAGAMLFEGSVVGQASRVGPRAVVSGQVRIWPHKVIEPGAKVTENLKTGRFYRPCFDEHGIAGEVGIELTAELCVKIGAGVATALRGDIALAQGESPACDALGDALSAGIRSAGSDVVRLGTVPAPVLGYCLGCSDAVIGLYIDDGGLRMMSAAGLEVNRATERAIEGALAREEYRRVEAERFGRERHEGVWLELYGEMMRREAGNLSGLSADVASGDQITQRFLDTLLKEAGMGAGGLKFYIDPSQGYISAGTGRGTLSRSRCLLIAAMPDVLRGRDVALPGWMPPISEIWAAEHGSRVLRYSASPSDDSDSEARRLAAGQGWQQDPIFAMLRILRFMKQQGWSLDELDAELPAFTEEAREVAITGNPAWIVGALGGKRLTDGIQLDLPGGSILVRPTKRGNAIRLLAQAYSSEVAAELCNFVADRIGRQGSNSLI